eukprot:6173496-Pleurochrysis_carterae.AAC.3
MQDGESAVNEPDYWPDTSHDWDAGHVLCWLADADADVDAMNVTHADADADDIKLIGYLDGGDGGGEKPERASGCLCGQHPFNVCQLVHVLGVQVPADLDRNLRAHRLKSTRSGYVAHTEGISRTQRVRGGAAQKYLYCMHADTDACIWYTHKSSLKHVHTLD